MREILTLLCCITLSSSRENQNQRSPQEVARRISGTVVREIYAQVKTYQVPITNSYPSHYIICHLPLVFLSPTSPLPFYSPSFPFASFCLLLVCLCVGLFVTMSQDNNKLCDFSNTNNNDFLSTPISPLTDAESCEINTALLNLVMKIHFLAFLVKMSLPI